MNRPSFSSNFSVGFVLFVATMLLVMTFFWVGSGQGIFSQKTYYEAQFPSTSGLTAGATVKLSGVPVGIVQDIEFVEDLKVNKVRVTLAVDSKVAPRIRKDSLVWLQTEGLLGDYSVHISMGTAEHDPLSSYDLIPYESRSMMEGIVGEEITRDTSVLMQQMIAILQEIQQGKGTFGKLLKDPELYRSISGLISSLELFGTELNSISAGVNEMISKVKEERGLLGKVLFSGEYEEKIARSLDEATELILELKTITGKLHRGEGSIGKFVTDGKFYDESVVALRNISSVAESMDQLLTRAKQGKGVIGRALVDDDLGTDLSQLVGRLNRSARSLENVLGVLERGEGSLGLFLHDPSLYASLRNVVLGVQEMGYLQNLIRNAEERGQEASLRNKRLTFARFQELKKASQIVRGTYEEEGEGNVKEGPDKGSEESPE